MSRSLVTVKRSDHLVTQHSPFIKNAEEENLPIKVEEQGGLALDDIYSRETSTSTCWHQEKMFRIRKD